MRIAHYNIRPFVVVLQEMPEKEKFIRNHFESVGFQAESFNGIHGVTSGFRTVFPYEADAPGSGWNIGTKPVATWLSFYMLYSALNLLPDTHFWLTEWDCKFPADWRNRAEKALQDVPPDFDFLFMGSCCCKGRPATHIKGEVWDVRWPQCGHSTIVAKKAIPMVIRTQRKCYAPLDISMMLWTLPHLRVYTVLPRICDQFDTELSP